LTRCLVASAFALTAFAQSQVKKDEADTSGVVHTAQIIQVLPEMNEMNEFARSQSDAAKVMRLRQHILEKVVAASLQVDATIAQIDNEIAQSNEIRGYLSDKRDKAVNRANLLSIVSAGTLGATSAGLQLPSGENKASSIVGIAAGLVSSSLAISGIRAQKGGTRIFDFILELSKRRGPHRPGSPHAEGAPRSDLDYPQADRLAFHFSRQGQNRPGNQSAFRQTAAYHRRFGRSLRHAGRRAREGLIPQTRFGCLTRLCLRNEPFAQDRSFRASCTDLGRRFDTAGRGRHAGRRFRATLPASVSIARIEASSDSRWAGRNWGG